MCYLSTCLALKPTVNVDSRAPAADQKRVPRQSQSFLQYFHGGLFWSVFAFLYALLILCVALEFYYKGMWSIYRDASGTVHRWKHRIVHIADGRICILLLEI